MAKRHCFINTPAGTLRIEENDFGISSVHFTENRDDDTDEKGQFLSEAAKQLLQYFAGERREFSVPLSLSGTDFQMKVWRELMKIPYGKTLCYGDIAAAIGKPAACRAVGMAIHRNPVDIIAPCHRVIGKDGSLTGYAEGLDKKRFLLELERSDGWLRG